MRTKIPEETEGVLVPPFMELIHTSVGGFIVDIFKEVDNEFVKGWVMEASVLLLPPSSPSNRHRRRKLDAMLYPGSALRSFKRNLR